MSTLTKNILGFLLLVITVFVAMDALPAENKNYLGTVIHKTVIPVQPEDMGKEKPVYLIIVWTAKDYQPLRLQGSREDWNNIDIGDKLMIYFREGTITNYNYSLTVQGGFEEY